MRSYEIGGGCLKWSGNNKGNPMLILARRVGETPIINSDVRVTVLGMRGGQIRIGINAPKNVTVHREEVFDRIKREENAAAEAVGENWVVT